jgi:hypothetical protein
LPSLTAPFRPRPRRRPSLGRRSRPDLLDRIRTAFNLDFLAFYPCADPRFRRPPAVHPKL